MALLTVKIEGLQQLQRRIQALNDKTRKKVLGGAVAAGALVTLKAARQKAPVKTGGLKESIKQRRSRKYSKQDYEERHVGVFKTKGKYGNTKLNRRLGRVGKDYDQDPPEYYWRFLEFGTVKMRGKPFLRPAFESTKAAAVQKIKDETLRRLGAALKELPK